MNRPLIRDAYYVLRTATTSDGTQLRFTKTQCAELLGITALTWTSQDNNSNEVKP